eukprot:TRINITY_DN255_c0_g1_i5.p1 TRINITY_DN255_c0_g1~~TRINITY_DN255_c0_g1_i5.p1  ORF type:complete len:124 (-),score=18.14 TRINITY_DN255_c0_g1_i5:170-541(-)
MSSKTTSFGLLRFSSNWFSSIILALTRSSSSRCWAVLISFSCSFRMFLASSSSFAVKCTGFPLDEISSPSEISTDPGIGSNGITSGFPIFEFLLSCFFSRSLRCEMTFKMLASVESEENTMEV